MAVELTPEQKLQAKLAATEADRNYWARLAAERGLALRVIELSRS